MNAQFSFAEYQEGTAKTAIYPGQGTALGLVYCALKLAGESGEVAENVGKAIRDDGLLDNKLVGHPKVLQTAACYMRDLSVDRHNKLVKELGDALWYISQMATELDISLAELAEANLAKLADRQARGVLKGSGDDR